MFYCNDCKIKNDWPESFNESYGKCEICNKMSVCNDVSSSHLPKPKNQTSDTSINRYKENPSQTTQILWYLKEGKTLTPIDALNMFGCFRLGARIFDIKKMGFNISSKLITTSTNKVVSEYKLINGYTQGKLAL